MHERVSAWNDWIFNVVAFQVFFFFYFFHFIVAGPRHHFHFIAFQSTMKKKRREIEDFLFIIDDTWPMSFKALWIYSQFYRFFLRSIFCANEKFSNFLRKKKKNDSNGEKCYVNNSVQNKENGTLEKEGKRKPEQQKRERHRQNGNKNRVIKKDLVNSTPEPFT